MIAWFRSKKKIKALTSSKDDFVSLSSHELRSPLSIIKWYTEILLDGDAGPLTEDQRRYLTVIEASNQRAIDLVRSLLNVSRLDLGTFSISPEEVSFKEILNEVVLSYKEKAAAKKVEIIASCADDLPVMNIDKHLSGLVLKQLLGNAILFSREGEVITVAVSCMPAHSQVEKQVLESESIVVGISDTGIGIPEQDQEKIFSKMFRASNVKDSEGTGSGLGLYIVKTIMESVGGKVFFTSILNKGSIFYVTFPTKGMQKKEGKTTLD